MISFLSFTGRVIDIHHMDSNRRVGCVRMMKLQNEHGSLVNFILSPTTYVLHQEAIAVGDIVTGYYDANAPAILIYPPQYPALVMVKERKDRFVKVSYFNNELISEDYLLQINPSPQTPIITTNGQPYTENPVHQHLLVIYGASTKSIPALTTPNQVIVLCS